MVPAINTSYTVAPEVKTSPGEALNKLTGIIVRGRWLILLTGVVVVVAIIAYLYRIPNRYTSEATLIVVPQQIPTRYVTPTSETNIGDALQTMTQDVLARGRLLDLIEQFGLYKEERKHLASEEVIDLMRKNIVIDPVDGAAGRQSTNAFKISFVAENGSLAQEVTSKLTLLFIQANLKTREEQAANTTSFLEAQVESAKEKLAEQEARVRDFKTQYLGELPEQQQSNLSILSGAEGQLQNITASLDRAQQQRVYMESLMESYRRLVTRGSPISLSGPASRPVPTSLQIAQNDLDRLQLEKAVLLTRYSPTHHDVRAIEQKIAATQSVMDGLQNAPGRTTENPPDAGNATSPPAVEEDNSIAQLRSQMESNRLEIANLTRDQETQKGVIAQYQSRLNLTPVREQQLTGILRDYELSKQDYTDLRSKERQSQLATNLEKQQGGQQFRLIEPPSLPDIPSSPKRVRLSLAAVGVGLLLGLAGAIIKEASIPTFRTTKEITRKLGAPFVVALPVVLTEKEEKRRTVWRAFEWLSGSVVLLAICAAEFYVLRHP